MDWFGKSDKANEGAVVDMAHRQAEARYAPLKQIDGYWNALRGGRVMPLRSEIDPRGLKGALEYCFVLERIAPGLARLRVAGSHLGDLMGMEVRGMPISAFLTSGSRQKFGEMLEEVFETPCTAELTLDAETGFGRPKLGARMILMPVRSDLGDTSRILGGFVTDADFGRAPRRFDVTDIKLTKINGRDPKPTEVPAPLATDAFRAAERPADLVRPTSSVPGLNEAPKEFAEAIPGVSYLRVVK